MELVNGLGFIGSGSPKNMNQQQRDTVRDDLQEWWESFLSNVDLWAKATADPSSRGDQARIDIRDQTLLGKPIGQLTLVRAFLLMRDRCEGVPTDELYERLNSIDWSVGNEMWHGVLMNPNGRVMSGRATVNQARFFIAHLGGAVLTKDERETLLGHIYGDEWEEHTLPDPVA